MPSEVMTESRTATARGTWIRRNSATRGAKTKDNSTAKVMGTRTSRARKSAVTITTKTASVSRAERLGTATGMTLAGAMGVVGMESDMPAPLEEGLVNAGTFARFG